MKAKTLIGRSAFSKLPALRISARSAKHRHRKFKQNHGEGESMADENQMDQGPAVSPQAEEKPTSGVTHPREAAEDLRSAAGASADEDLGRGKEYGMTRAIASAVFRTTASNTSARTRRSRSLRRSRL